MNLLSDTLRHPLCLILDYLDPPALAMLSRFNRQLYRACKPVLDKRFEDITDYRVIKQGYLIEWQRLYEFHLERSDTSHTVYDIDLLIVPLKLNRYYTITHREPLTIHSSRDDITYTLGSPTEIYGWLVKELFAEHLYLVARAKSDDASPKLCTIKLPHNRYVEDIFIHINANRITTLLGRRVDRLINFIRKIQRMIYISFEYISEDVRKIYHDNLTVQQIRNINIETVHWELIFADLVEESALFYEEYAKHPIKEILKEDSSFIPCVYSESII